MKGVFGVRLLVVILAVWLTACGNGKTKPEALDGDEAVRENEQAADVEVDPIDGDHYDSETIDPCQGKTPRELALYEECSDYCNHCADDLLCRPVYDLDGNSLPRCTKTCGENGPSAECPAGYECFSAACTDSTTLHLGAYYEACRYQGVSCQAGLDCLMVRASGGENYDARCTKSCSPTASPAECPSDSSCVSTSPEFSATYLCMKNDDLHDKPYGANCLNDLDCAGEGAFCGFLNSCSTPCQADLDCPEESFCLLPDDVLRGTICGGYGNRNRSANCVPKEKVGSVFDRPRDESCITSQVCAEGLTCVAFPMVGQICTVSCESAPCDAQHECVALEDGKFCVKKERNGRGEYGDDCLDDTDCLSPLWCKGTPNPNFDNCIRKWCYNDDPYVLDGDRDVEVIEMEWED